MSFNMFSSHCSSNKTPQTGAVLLAVLVVALALVILLGVVSHALNDRINLAQQAKQNLQDHAEVYAKINELGYLLTTQRVTVAGISSGQQPQGLLKDDEDHWLLEVIGDEIRTDSFTYTQPDQLQYSIQNEAGLIGINSRGQFWLKKTLASYGFSVVEQAKFADILADYADRDDWARPAGAESYAYQKINKPIPRNYLLQSCAELWRLERWSEWLYQHNEWLEFCSVSRDDTRNINSIPFALWKHLWPASADKVYAQRAAGRWFIRNKDIVLVEPSIAHYQEENYSQLFGNVFILNVSKGRVFYSIRVEIGKVRQHPFVWR
jgi:general secretion pathway protein K